MKQILLMIVVVALVGCVPSNISDGPQVHGKLLGNLSSMGSRELCILYNETHTVSRKNRLRSALLRIGFSKHDLVRIEHGDVVGMREDAAFAAFGSPIFEKTTELADAIHKSYTFRTVRRGHFKRVKVLVVNGSIVKIEY